MNVPEFASREEEAIFWDQFDLGEFEDELEPVELEVAHTLGHILSIRIESEAFRRLCVVGRENETNIISLAETWVLDALDRATMAEPTGRTVEHPRRRAKAETVPRQLALPLSCAHLPRRGPGRDLPNVVFRRHGA